MYLFGCVIFIGLLILILGLTSSLLLFVDIPSLILILGFTLPILTASGLFGDFVRSFKLITSRENSASRFELNRMLLANQLAMVMFIISGVLGTIIGGISILNFSEIGENIFPSVAVSLITTLYGLIFVILLIPVRAKLKAIILSLE
jgi:hypothetical protein